MRTDSLAGFRRDDDDGVAWGTDITFAGAQRVFDPAAAHEADERCALGACGDDYAAETFCGNTFDYPSLHGRAIAAAGWSYCSASAGALVRGDVAAEEYDAIDLVLGKQRTVTVGRGTRGAEFRTFPPVLRAARSSWRAAIRSRTCSAVRRRTGRPGLSRPRCSTAPAATAGGPDAGA